MPVIEELIAVLGYEIDGKGNLKKFNEGLDDAEVKAKKSSKQIRNIGIAAGAATTGAIALASSGFKNFAAFERQMNRIGVTAGASAQETADASEQVQKLARDVALPVAEAVKGLDTLVASGQSLEQAMAFLPSVLATAQASGAATDDIANTALKAASALGIEAKDLQKAFDIMVEGGKAGQFELKDMAQYIPDLANSFAQMGYKGEDGLKRLVAILQTIREDTGSASAAATNAQNVFFKMFSPETERNFKKFGVNIREEMAAAVKAGKDPVEEYLRITQQVLDSNPTMKLGDLFRDQQFQLGMQSLLTSGESLKKFMDVLNGSDVDGTVFRDLNRVIGDTQASVDRLSNSWDMFMKSVGKAVAQPVSNSLDFLTSGITKADAINTQLEKEGKSFLGRRVWWALNGFDVEEQDKLARQGGWKGDTDEQKAVANSAPEAWKILGRMPNRPVSRPAPRIPESGAAPAGMPETAAMKISRALNPAGSGGMASGLSEVKPSPDLSAISEALQGANAHLGELAGRAAVQPVITDARQDNRSFPVSVSAPVTVNVQQPTAAPAAVGAAVSSAVGKAATDSASRVEQGPAF